MYELGADLDGNIEVTVRNNTEMTWNVIVVNSKGKIVDRFGSEA